jgi:hypothetical protein
MLRCSIVCKKIAGRSQLSIHGSAVKRGLFMGNSQHLDVQVCERSNLEIVSHNNDLKFKPIKIQNLVLFLLRC